MKSRGSLCRTLKTYNEVNEKIQIKWINFYMHVTNETEAKRY
jgi:hypothetical protein